MTERKWVNGLIDTLNRDIRKFSNKQAKTEACDACRVPYSCQIPGYLGPGTDKPQDPHISSYETDLLIRDVAPDGSWVPRVVIECKLGSITTHDALTYSTKASTHKQVHPYLRYGILMGNREHYAIPGRLVRHGAHFDFMVTWADYQPTKRDWSAFTKLLELELKASRALQTLLSTSRSSSRKKYQILHKPLTLD